MDDVIIVLDDAPAVLEIIENDDFLEIDDDAPAFWSVAERLAAIERRRGRAAAR